MRSAIVRCGVCGGVLNVPQAVGAGTVGCGHCGASAGVWLFPALHRSRISQVAAPVLEEGQSGCLNHPGKQATAVCDACGKYMCALCDVEWNGEHLCPTCIGHRRREDTGKVHRTRYTHYDMIALAIAVFSFLSMYFAIFTAPVALFVGWRYWNAPWRPVPYRKWTMVLSMVLAGVILLGWLSLLGVLIFQLATELN